MNLQKGNQSWNDCTFHIHWDNLSWKIQEVVLKERIHFVFEKKYTLVWSLKIKTSGYIIYSKEKS